MHVIVVPYRDGYFYREFGPAVRDLQFIEILSQKFSMTVINRPVSVYERFKKKASGNAFSIDSIDMVDVTSYDLIGPLKGRSWARSCYKNIVSEVLKKYRSEKILFLDFSPFSDFAYVSSYSNVTYWYDMIDNFSIHNRYSEIERKLVKNKYSEVGSYANIITGVSETGLKCILGNTGARFVVPNGVFQSPYHASGEDCSINAAYDFGFIGFVTNKFDVEFVNKLSEKYSVAIWGKCFDKKVLKFLSSSIDYNGAFNYKDIPNVMKMFKVGLLPYKKELLHDESPLKMYEYFKYSRPCVASVQYEIKSPYYLDYTDVKNDDLEKTVQWYLSVSGRDKIRDQIEEGWYLANRIDAVLQYTLG